ncbi:MAG: cytochrome c3 family protein [Candidatus Latescibacterota bacterium]|nr:cytochrome c3 family protein [Candidatus Latescibacterota bacterium]MED5415858.1 cytochrome c3 family protein [Candidatus Latescibacterota bacterium]MEE3337207.1 cytochrome c3 family protein [Candidatus Latescibacterota bacterium]
MAQVFHRSSNWLARFSIIAVIGVTGLLFSILLNINRIDYVSEVGVAIDQPVPFSHKHHVEAIGIDCRYCHTSVEESAFAGIPPVETCMTCHSLIWTEAPNLEPIRTAWRDEKPLQWNRVHDLPDFVYFRHNIHIAKGIGCTSCHGAINEMPLVWVENALNMEWCLDCHRNPEKHIRPRDRVFDVHWTPPADQEAQGLKLVEEYDVRVSQLTDCSVCHL